MFLEEQIASKVRMTPSDADAHGAACNSSATVTPWASKSPWASSSPGAPVTPWAPVTP